MTSSLSKNLPAGALEKIKKRFFESQTQLRDWMQANSMDLVDLKDFSYKMLAALSLVGQIAFTKPAQAQVTDQLEQIAEAKKDQALKEISEQEKQAIVDKMIAYVNLPPGHLDSEEEKYLEQQLSDLLGFEVEAELDGHRLNHSIGIMGGEQHLMRFPGDNLASHDAYREAGIASNRGAFGWFTQNGQLTQEAIMREKYYFAVQTLYLPDWNTNHSELKPWYKFRKMIMINPHEGLAIVGVVADAGPAMWVKKQFGGSPEVIREGRLWSAKVRGKVILYFVDDPEDKVALGVYDLNSGEYLSNDKIEEVENE